MRTRILCRYITLTLLLALLWGCGTTKVVMIGTEQYPDTYSKDYVFEAPTGEPRKVSVMDFVNKTSYGQRRLGSAASDILSNEIVKTGLFNVVEREKLSLAVEELNLSETGLIDPEQAAEVGKYLGAQIIITGSVSQFGNRIEGKDYIFYQSKSQIVEAVVDIRLIDVETTRVLGAFTGKGLVSKTTSALMGAGGRAGYDETLEGEALRAAVINVVEKLSGWTY